MKTKVNDRNINDFLNEVQDQQKKKDCFELLRIMSEITGEPAKMWGESIVGFGSYHYRYDSGREGDWFLTGFSPRKQNLTIYITSGFWEYEEILKGLGKHKTSSSCLYVKKLNNIDKESLKALIERSIKEMKNRYKD